MHRLVLIALFLAGCGKSRPDWLEALWPTMEHALAGQRAAAPKVLAAIATAKSDVPCASLPTAVPYLSRELVDELGAGKHELKETNKIGEGPFLASNGYLALFGGDNLTYTDKIKEEVELVDRATVIGVFVGDKVDLGRIDGSSIVAPGSFEGRFVLVELATGKILTSIPISATTNSFMMSSGRFETALRNNLASNARVAVVKACPKLVLDTGP
jgi:hypothetical protein